MKNFLDNLIIELDKDKRKVALSIKALEDKEAKEAVKKYGSTDSGGVLGDILGKALNLKMKKKLKNKKELKKFKTLILGETVSFREDLLAHSPKITGN
mgnify:CR=1 FL=1